MRFSKEAWRFPDVSVKSEFQGDSSFLTCRKRDGHRTTPFACRMKHSVRYCRSDRDDGSFACAGGCKVGTVEEVDVEFGDVVEAWYFVFAE